MVENKAEYYLMSMAEERHWWYVTLHQRVFAAINNQFSNKKDIAILDAGCGTGGLWVKLLKAGYTNIAGIDIADFAIEICNEKGLKPIKANIKQIDSIFNGQTFDVIICNDVLCYFNIRNAKDVVRKLTSLLSPGGLLIMNNPAHATFSGTHDIAVGIQTRFYPNELRQIISHQLSVIRFTQWPFLLSPLIWIERKKQRSVMYKGGKILIKSDVVFPPKGNNLLLKINNIERLIFKRAPFGSSVFIVARKG
jgi:SAM-dependent methyltransferase